MKTKSALPILLFFATFLAIFFGQSTISADSIKPIQGIQATANHTDTLSSISIPEKIQAIKSDSKANVADTSDKKATKNYSDLINLARKQLGKDYVWGAVGPDTFDCSGLTQYLFANAYNKTLPRTAAAQYAAFDHVSHDDAQPGDLVFFSYNGGASIDHVGIVVSGDNQMIDVQDRGVLKESYMASYWKPYIAGYAHVMDLK
ncbi:hypothetical protein BSQ38_07430 [Pediococcus damnosus]|uniref:C40 family peptidase n=1 Tax=Pediococcus damnosus TaxID=51663 RepID=UPI000C1CA18A|nr:NlpC/P60 family protein [Pediococcus damnosus]PIO81485.1 hypothetical protein BSQ38_07430 [Pediococcus damnosus]